MDERELLRAHLREVRRFEPPTRAEEHDLAVRAQTGDTDARNELVERNARLIGEILNLYYVDLSVWFRKPSTISLPDLIQEGYLGMIEAVDRYDTESPWRFTTYAGSWVRKYISAALSPSRTGVELPDHARRASRRLASTEERMMQQLGRRPTNEELAAQCGVTEERMLELRAATETPLFLDAVADVPSPIDAPDLQAQCGEIVRLAQSYLPERELLIVSRHYGLDGSRPESFAEIADDLGLSRQRTWELYRAALTHLRSLLGAT